MPGNVVDGTKLQNRLITSPRLRRMLTCFWLVPLGPMVVHAYMSDNGMKLFMSG